MHVVCYSVATDEKFYLVSARSPEVLEVDRLNFDIKLSRKFTFLCVERHYR